MKKALFFIICILNVFIFTQKSFSQNASTQETKEENPLLITVQDIRIVPDGKTFAESQGYHLYIKKKLGIESILLTETTKDPDGKSDSFAYRATQWNSVNGNEIRYLDGKVLDSQYSRYSLVDSTTENLEGFGECFHIYIPSQIEYGYPWERNGSVKIGRGTFINIRSFQKKYADYTGDYYDNPYMFDLGKKLPPPQKTISEPIVPPIPKDIAPEVLEKEQLPVILTDDYNPIASQKFEEIASSLEYSKGPETIVDDIMKVLKTVPDGSVFDCVFAIDATGSMIDDIQELRSKLIPELVLQMKRFKSTRLGLVLYRDYVDSWRYKGLPLKFFDFTQDSSEFLYNLNSFTISGREGGDIPEAVYEALFASMDFYIWNPKAIKKVILIGDAEPHPRPRGTGKYTKDLITKMSIQKGITINAIIVPDDKARRGR